jgi:hypothetical protein
MSEPKPKKRRNRSVLGAKGSDGTWRELKPERPMSEDPEINFLWDLPIGELDAILQDAKHPLNEKAIAVTAQAFAPLQEAVKEWFKPGGAIAESLEPLKTVLPNVTKSWVSDVVLEYPAWQTFRRSLPDAARQEPLVVDDIDFDSETPPDATLGEIADAADDAAVIVLRELLEVTQEQLGVTRDQLTQARADASSNAEALTIAKGSKRAGWWAAYAALAAAFIALVGVIVTLLKP